MVLELYVQRSRPGQHGHGIFGFVRGFKQLGLVDVVRLERCGRSPLDHVNYLVDRYSGVLFRMRGPERAPLDFHCLGPQCVKEAQVVFDVLGLFSARTEEVVWREKPELLQLLRMEVYRVQVDKPGTAGKVLLRDFSDFQGVYQAVFYSFLHERVQRYVLKPVFSWHLFHQLPELVSDLRLQLQQRVHQRHSLAGLQLHGQR